MVEETRPYKFRSHANTYHLLTDDGKATRCGMSGMSIRFMQDYGGVGDRTLCGACNPESKSAESDYVDCDICGMGLEINEHPESSWAMVSLDGSGFETEDYLAWNNMNQVCRPCYKDVIEGQYDGWGKCNTCGRNHPPNPHYDGRYGNEQASHHKEWCKEHKNYPQEDLTDKIRQRDEELERQEKEWAVKREKKRLSIEKWKKDREDEIKSMGWLKRKWYGLAEDAELEFTDWAKQETKHHGKTSLKDWADHEMKKHGGKMSFQDWAKHEDKSHIDRYGAEEVGCPKCGDVEDYFINECCDTPNCFYCGDECYVAGYGKPINEDHAVNCTEHECCTEFMRRRRLYGAEEIWCDNCGEDGLSGDFHVVTSMPVDFDSGSAGESATLCGDCYSEYGAEAKVSDLGEDEDLLPVGTKVRSYDFWPNDSSYIEGVIEKIAPSPRCSPDCMHYHIRTTKTVRQGKEINENAIGEIFMTHPYEDFGWTLKRAKHIQVREAEGYRVRPSSLHPDADTYGTIYCKNSDCAESRRGSGDGIAWCGVCLEPHCPNCDDSMNYCDTCAQPEDFVHWSQGYVCIPCSKSHPKSHKLNPKKSYDKEWGAEELKKDSCCCGATKSNPCACMIQGVMECNATCPCSLEKKGAEAPWYDDSHIHALQYALREYAITLTDCLDGKYGRDDAEVVLDDLERKTQYFNLLNAENWGGDPKGKLALALQKARDKAKEPKKPLKIEKLGAEHECPHCLSELDGDMVELHESFVCPYCDKEMLSYRIRSVPAYEMGVETSGQWEIGEQLEEAQMNAEEFDRAIEDKKGHINYWNEKDRMQKYFKNWKPKSSPYEKRVVAETKTKWCENCGELDDNEEENWPWYQWVLKQKNSSKANFRWITGGACGGCGSDLCQNCLDGNTSGNFNPLFEPTCEDCGSAFCKECKDEDEDRCNTCQEEYEENVCDCCGYLHHAEGCEFNAPTKGIDTFTKPFEESSLDSGTVKKVVVGLGIGALVLFGYNKWK